MKCIRCDGPLDWDATPLCDDCELTLQIGFELAGDDEDQEPDDDDEELVDEDPADDVDDDEPGENDD